MDTKRKLRTNEGGFTLLELLIALTILLIVVAGIYETYNYFERTWLGEDIKAELQQTTRVAMDSMSREIMMTGYGAATGQNKITMATANAFEFKVYTKNGSSGMLYSVYYHIVNGNLVRDIKDGSDAAHMALPYPPGDQRILARNVTSLIFGYSYADGPALLSDLGVQAARDNIRRVTVSLTVQSSKPMPGTTTRKTMTLRADISLRNMYEGEMSLDTDPPPMITDLQVVDARDCGHLKVKWSKSTAGDVAGYTISYGTTPNNYSSTKDVGIGSLADPEHPETEIDVNYSPYLTNDVTYYVNIQAYDFSHNPSVPRTSDVSGNPFPNITSFNQSGNDTTCNKKKPDPPGSFTAAGQNRAVALSWTSPAYEGLVGYRVFRSYSAITAASFPLNDETYNLNSGNRIIEIAHEPGAGWTGPTLDQSATSFTDNDTNLVGCRPYYYAICAVGCDWTLVWGDGTDSLGRGGRYSSAQYATTNGTPSDDLNPSPPSISTGSKPGWKRVFIQHQEPTTNADGTPIKDYAYTMLFYTYTQGSAAEGAPEPPDPPVPVVSKDASGNLVLGAGTYLLPFIQGDLDINNDGTVSTADMGAVNTNRTIIFNNLTDPYYGATDPPLLPVNSKFRILAVAFDKCGNMSDTTNTVAMTLATLCGDEPSGYPTWPICQTTVPSVWFAGTTDNLDTSTWVGSPALTTLTAHWTDVDKGEANLDVDGNIIVCPGDPGGMIDFQGFGIRMNTLGSFPIITDNTQFNSAAGDHFPLWDPEQSYNNLSEGMTYYFDVQTTDCYFWSHNGASGNVSPDSTMPPFGIKPGRLDRYKRLDTLTVHPEYNVASTSGTYHTTVKFYMQNTSLSTMQINWMKFAWDNDVAVLKKVTIGPLTDGTQKVVTISGGDYNLTTVTGVDFPITNQATDPSTPSTAIPVTLEFTNSSGAVTSAVDMRGVTLVVEAGFTNDSIPSSGGMGLPGFTTGAYNGTNPITYLITFGATINSVKQNLPAARTPGYEVDTTAATYTAPSGFPEINGGSDVTISSDVTAPPGETVSTVKVKYVQTDLSVTDPGSLTFSEATATKSGTIYNAVIPGVTSMGTWYYVEATTAQGNITRSPSKPGSYYYYTSSDFDPCLETPTAPTSLQLVSDSPPFMKWSAPTTYISGSPKNGLDIFTYNVYRYIGLFGGTPSKIASGVTTLSYNDTAYSMYTSISNNPVRYQVSASNSCPNEGDKSNTITVCPPGGAGCALTASPVDVYAGQAITVNLAVCSAANDGIFSETGTITAASGVETKNFTIVETGDSGTGSLTFNTTNTGSSGALSVVPSGSSSDTVTISVTGALSASCANTTVHAYANPSINIPAAPTATATATGSNANVSWSAVTTNTDGSPTTYTAGSLPGDSITGYAVRSYFMGTDGTTTPPDPNVDLSSWTVSTNVSGTTLTSGNISISKGYTWFTVRALDTFGQGTFSTPVQVYR